ncbi:hypothetical protein [Falsiroseomonas oryziterrae]|uniref:hypothetical protein n=1 Tax=Falsiroseomonas oryziterrae TaxID=2911368 RepID=UPI001F2346DE|nr:hypothetical protein [Roseomonas sp. NPKOSM-4]
MRLIRAALAAHLLSGLPGAMPAFAQSSTQAEALRALREAEGELRDTIRRFDEGGLPRGMVVSRLRQALNEVERAMLRLPADARQGPPWQTAVREVSQAMAALRDEAADPAAARAAAGEALGTLPALRGEETGSSGG